MNKKAIDLLEDAKKGHNDECVFCAVKDTRINSVLDILKQHPPASKLTKWLREVISYQRYEKGDKELQAKVREACHIIDSSESINADLLAALEDIQDWLDTSSLQKILVHYCKKAPEQNALIMGIASHLTRIEAAIAKAKKGGE